MLWFLIIWCSIPVGVFIVYFWFDTKIKNLFPGFENVIVLTEKQLNDPKLRERISSSQISNYREMCNVRDAIRVFAPILWMVGSLMFVIVLQLL